MTTPIRQTTTVRYQGFHVTIIGELDAQLLAIAGYGTPQERAIAAITVLIPMIHPRMAVISVAITTAMIA